MKYLILAQYTKTGKSLWWCSSDNYTWKKGNTCFISGTTTQVKILDVLEISEDRFNELKNI